MVFALGIRRIRGYGIHDVEGRHISRGKRVVGGKEAESIKEVWGKFSAEIEQGITVVKAHADSRSIWLSVYCRAKKSIEKKAEICECS